jgi:hypothetical protein
MLVDLPRIRIAQLSHRIPLKVVLADVVHEITVAYSSEIGPNRIEETLGRRDLRGIWNC